MALRNLSLRVKLVLALLGVGLLAVAITGVESYRRARSALEAAALSHLTSIREERTRAVETHFARLRRETTTLAETQLIVEAMHRFAAAWDDLERQAKRLSPVQIETFRGRVTAYQRAQQGPSLPDREAEESIAEPATLLLQMLYAVADPAKPASGDDADRHLAARVASPYEEAHGVLDGPLRRLVERLGFEDLYLIDHRSGRIVFGIERDADLGTSLLTGPYRDTNLARAFRAARQAKDSSAVTLADFELYAPSRGEPNAFMAAPIFAGGGLIGVLAVELPAKPVDALMTGGQNWQAGGLGKTGETYLVGEDHRMRSNSRFLLQDPEAYLRRLTRTGVSEAVRRLIGLHRSTILLEQVSSPAAEAALAGRTGSEISRDYRGVESISAYGPVAIPGLHWGAIAKIDVAEALAPAVALRNLVVVTGVLIALGVGGLALALGASLTRPLSRLIDGMRQLGKGNLSHRVPLDRGDEVGQIATAFNEMANDLQETTVSRDYVNNILTSMTDAVIVVRPPAGQESEDWREAVVVTVNPSACALIGRSEAEITGRRIRDFIPEIATAGEGSRQAALWLEEVVRLGSIGGREAVYKIHDGREVPVLFSGALMRENDQSVGGIVWAAKDLTELKQIEARSAYIRETFGRYVSEDVVAALLSAPEALRLGGETRTVTILMSDLRGFTALAERLAPEAVVGFLNAYFDIMVALIMRYRGTINEILGDAILVIFGAPTSGEDDAERAVACAVEMQIAMERFSEERRRLGQPTVEMGIGLHTGPVIVGNIGTEQRAKYAAVGTAVNLTGRIESYTTGGQVLVSEDTHRAVRAPLVVNGRMQIEPKGAKQPLTVYDIVGIGEPYDLLLAPAEDALAAIEPPIPIRCAVLEEKHVGRSVFAGTIVGLSRLRAEIVAAERAAPLSNLKILLLDARGEPRPGDVYAKVLGEATSPGTFLVRFTSVAPEVAAELDARLPTHPR